MGRGKWELHDKSAPFLYPFYQQASGLKRCVNKTLKHNAVASRQKEYQMSTVKKIEGITKESTQEMIDKTLEAFPDKGKKKKGSSHGAQ